MCCQNAGESILCCECLSVLPASLCAARTCDMHVSLGVVVQAEDARTQGICILLTPQQRATLNPADHQGMARLSRVT